MMSRAIGMGLLVAAVLMTASCGRGDEEGEATPVADCASAKGDLERALSERDRRTVDESLATAMKACAAGRGHTVNEDECNDVRESLAKAASLERKPVDPAAVDAIVELALASCTGPGVTVTLPAP